MKNTQLRTGNLVLYKGEVKTIDGILRGHVCLLEHSKDGKYGNWIDLDEIEFIPITEDLLINLGFYNISHEKWGFTKAPTDYILEKQDNWFFIGIKPDNTTVYFSWDIYHVHQLQNIIFALTGSELIKTP